jgi:hypothetical protein
MKYIKQDIQLIRQFNTPLSGVFLISDLIYLMNEPHKTAVYRRIHDLEELGVIERFIKGTYIASDVDLQILNQKICPASCISFGTILADHGIIPFHPEHQLDVIKPGKTRIHANKRFRVRQFGILSDLMFGFEHSRGVNRAAPEKALLDTFYFHQHGVEFPFDIYNGINWKRVDKEILHIYLQEYQNPKFVSFVQGLLQKHR